MKMFHHLVLQVQNKIWTQISQFVSNPYHLQQHLIHLLVTVSPLSNFLILKY